MSDLYLELSHSQMGSSLFDALKLPKPAELFRSPDTPLQAPVGKVLVGGLKNGFALKHIVAALDSESIKLCSLKLSTEQSELFSPHIKSKADQKIELFRTNGNAGQRIKHVVLDATSLHSAKDSQALWYFFNSLIKRIKKNGRVVIVGREPESEDDIHAATFAEALEGFVKSVAKELGKRGSSCNLLRVKKGSERQLKSALYYLLGEKSCFVTGQSLTVQSHGPMPRKIHWPLPLKGKTAIVTGAAQGIGAQTARTLARDGAKVVCLDIPANAKKLTQLSNEIGGHPLSLDLGEAEACETLTQTVASQLGPIDIIVHNAGITRDKTLANMPIHFWNQVMDINLGKIIEINEALLSKKLFAPRARILCVSSISGIAGNFGQTNYALSKAGVAGYTRKLATLLDKGMTVNAVAPGFIETDMTKNIPAMARQMGRRSNSFSQGGEPLDVAEAISFFCHPASQSLNGNVLRVCGQNLLGR